MFKLFFIGLISSTILFSCGEQNTDEPKGPTGNDNSYNWNEPIKAAVNYGEEEMAIAKRVCESFQNKRAFLATQPRGLVLDYRVSDQSCGSEEPQVERAQGQMTMSRDGSIAVRGLTVGTSVFDDVLTEKHTRLEPFCDQVFQNVVPSNTRTVGQFRYQVNFFNQEDRDWVQIAEFQARNGIFYPFLIERSSVVTEATGGRAEQRGFVSLRAINRPCSDGSTQFIMQEWL